MTMEFCVYWLRSNVSHYIGSTNNLGRRLRQHNGELSGGSYHTRGKTWYVHCKVTGFANKKEALRFEFSYRHKCKKRRGLREREEVLHEMLQTKEWCHLVSIKGGGD